MLGPIDLRKIPCGNGDLLFPITSTECGDEHVCRSQIGAVILGGETGSKARPTNPDWVRKVRDDCAAAGVPFFFKQWGEFIPADQKECPMGPPRKRWIWTDGKPFEDGDNEREGEKLMCRVGRNNAGRVLDGRTHDALSTPSYWAWTEVSMEELKGWIIKSPVKKVRMWGNDSFLISTFRPTKDGALRKFGFSPPYKPWLDYYRRGYRCVKAQIREGWK
jgi:hypothetical protein